MIVRNNSTTRGWQVGSTFLEPGSTKTCEDRYYDDISGNADLTVTSGAPADLGKHHDTGPVMYDIDPVTRGIKFSTPDSSDALTDQAILPAKQITCDSDIPRMRASQSAPISSLAAPTETVPALLTTGNHYYIDPIAGLDTNAGTSPAQPWKSLSKLVGLSSGNGAAIHLAADGVFSYEETWTAFKARTLFPYDGMAGLRSTVATSPNIIKPYYPRATKAWPIVRWYAAITAAEWTQEAGIGPNVWSIPCAVGDLRAFVLHLGDALTGVLKIAGASAGTDPAGLAATGEYVKGASKIYVYAPSNPTSYFGYVHISGWPVFSTQYFGLNNTKVTGIQFEKCTAFSVLGDGDIPSVGLHIYNSKFIKARALWFRNGYPSATFTSLTGSIPAGSDVMTITAMAGAPGTGLRQGHIIAGTGGIATNTVVLYQISGTAGGAGDYKVSKAQTVAITVTNISGVEYGFSLHDNYLEDVPMPAIHAMPASGNAAFKTTTATVSWEIYKNTLKRGNLAASYGGAMFYNQSIGGERHHAWGNYGYDCRNGTGGAGIDGSMLYADLTSKNSVFCVNVAELCGTAFQANSCVGALILANLSIDCVSFSSVTGAEPGVASSATVAHNTHLWTGRVKKEDIPIGPSHGDIVFSQYNAAFYASGNVKFTSYTALNNLAVFCDGTGLGREIARYDSLGITTALVKGFAVAGGGDSGLVQDRYGATVQADMTAVADVVLLRTDTPTAWMADPVNGSAVPAINSPIKGAGLPLAVAFNDFAGKVFKTFPTVGCLEGLF